MVRHRQTNIEVLRIISMFLIVIMHYIFCGLKHNPFHQYYDLGSISGGVNYLTMEPLYLLSQVAVNCYVMISGFFLIDRNQYRWKGILMTIVNTMFYSLVFLFLAKASGTGVTNVELAKSIFPIHQWGYWFVTTYVGLLLVAPLLSRIASSLNKRQYQFVLCTLFILNFQYLYGTVYAGHRTIMFFGFLFLLAGYMRLHGIPKWILHWKVYLFILIWGLLFLFATTVNIWKGCFERNCSVNPVIVV